ncbi:MAG: dihydrodipicolinate synthase family protein [Opitutae bacterium]|nr:dihydrodipicolinate synthase family protein [Opitutae bacterium]
MTGSSPSALRYPPVILGTVCVPWNEDHSFAAEAFRRTTRLLRSRLTPHLYLFGTAGEGYAVTDTQFETICRVFAEEMGGDGAWPMIGVISLSLGTVIERIECARALGFRRFQISLPCWGALADDELRRFFDETCGRFPECGFLHYNLPRAKRLLTGADYAELARRHPNLVATKQGGNPADAAGLMRQAPMLTHFFGERTFARASQAGECGLLISLASINPAAGRQFFAAAQARDTAQLQLLADELQVVLDIVLGLASGIAHMDGAFDKAFCRMLVPDFPLRLLPPYASFNEDQFARMVEEIRRRAPRWQPPSA